MNSSNSKNIIKNNIIDIMENNKKNSNIISNSSLNIIENNNKKSNIISNSSSNIIEKYKKNILNNSLITMLSIKNIVTGSVRTVIPWTILLIIIGFIIII